MLSPLEIERNELGYTLEEVRGKFLRVVERSCPSSDTCVFMMHGGGGRAGQFKHQIKALEAEFNVVALDFLGHGDSPKPNQPALYTADQHFEDLRAVYERHKKERNVLVAHCYGSIHTLRLMKWLREQGREGEVKGVVLISLGASALSVGVVSKLPAFFLEWARPLARASSNATIFTPKTDPALIEFENSISNGNRMYTMKVIGADCSNQQAWTKWLDDGREGLGEIPRALICGEEDGVFPVSACEQAKKVLGVEDEWFQIVPSSGHLSMLESPHEVNRIIKDFLSACL